MPSGISESLSASRRFLQMIWAPIIPVAHDKDLAELGLERILQVQFPSIYRQPPPKKAIRSLPHKSNPSAPGIF
ncbi:MAG: hypothetical protein C4519_10595 [Desulfobacteraceae bacterium]|nr:MAG: hypothetical protein C4519_10595 [Desulfobacteraceae bacterium]